MARQASTARSPPGAAEGDAELAPASAESAEGRAANLQAPSGSRKNAIAKGKLNFTV
jgi:hypothetical protein